MISALFLGRAISGKTFRCSTAPRPPSRELQILELFPMKGNTYCFSTTKRNAYCFCTGHGRVGIPCDTPSFRSAVGGEGRPKERGRAATFQIYFYMDPNGIHTARIRTCADSIRTRYGPDADLMRTRFGPDTEGAAGCPNTGWPDRGDLGALSRGVTTPASGRPFLMPNPHMFFRHPDHGNIA